MTISYRNRVEPFAAQYLEAIAKVLGDTENGLTGSEIEHFLSECGVHDSTPSMTKWKRLYNALVEFQNVHRVGNHVVKFITRALAPSRYTAKPEIFRDRKDRLNAVLAFCGMAVGEDGTVRHASKAANLDQALERANRMKSQLQQRNVHDDVLAYCDAEIVARNYFHAVFEAMKSVSAKIRNMSGLTSDGAALVDGAFGLGPANQPLLAINALGSDTLLGEQRGFANLLKGLYGTVRNPLAHNPKIEWNMSEQDTLDILTTISLVHRKLDKAYKYGTRQ